MATSVVGGLPSAVTTTADSSSSDGARSTPRGSSGARFFLQDRIRAWVSKKKRRFQEKGYDLDLTYVTPRLIAMGFPAVNHEAAYRNSAEEIETFLDSQHGRGNYKLYNLCAERTYPEARFGGAFVRFPFEDHSPPPLGMIYFFCVDVDELFRKDEKTVAAIHCKAGKGRTGLMIAAYMLWAREWATPAESMQFYGFARTNNQKGITIPSQRRFVEYFHETIYGGGDATSGPTPPHIRRESSSLPAQSTSNDDDDDDDVVTSVWGASRRVVREVVRNSVSRLSTGEEDDSESDDGDDDDGNLATKIAPTTQVINLDDYPSNEQLDELDDGLSIDSCIIIRPGEEASGERQEKPPTSDDEEEEVDDDEEERPPSTMAARSPTTMDPPQFVPQTSLDERDLEASEAASEGFAAVHHFVASFEHLWRDGAPAFAGGAPTVRKSKHRLLNGDWNRLNRLHARGRRGALPPPKMLAINQLIVHRARPNNVLRGHFEPHFKILCQDFEYKSSELFACASGRKSSHKAPATRLAFPIPNAIVVDEVCVVFFNKKTLGRKEKAFKFWFHTAFVRDNRLYIAKPDLDGACKDKKHAKFDADFAVELGFTEDFHRK
ncbi:hypothetical protein CTAYLR_004353 [Chrysophaeum taylorii]|uniref:Phosphatidylinositol 3,4,5-trisphosphate 3-phosphatase and dual-specificity protein phosphatase PTEN n=1 Tax=Chrysophaeum taylorii TaxID=2483200 RepID=A0AAD7UMA4_9STRA|nr:hypothetical protein CTAYLR_004353 [Chrysophaeum taylorii]